MSWREFFASAIGSLAWPLSVFGLGLLFRSKIKDLLTAGPLRRLKAPGIEAEWAETAGLVEQAVSDAVEPSASDLPPEVAAGEPAPGEQFDAGVRIMVNYVRLLNGLRKRLGDEGVPFSMEAKASELASIGVANGVVDEPTRRAVEGVQVLRDLAAHGRPTKAQSAEFAALSRAVLYGLDTPRASG